MTRRPAGLLALAIVLAGCAGRDKDEVEQPVPLPALEPALRVDRIWSARVGGDAEKLRLALTPASDGASVYAAAHDGRVAAFDAQSGAQQWRVDLELPIAAGPACGEELLVVGSSDGDVAALSARDGSTRWARNIGAEVLATPAISGGRVFVRTVNGSLHALDTGTGSEVWSLQHDVPRLSLRGNASPVIAGDRVVAAFDDGKVGAYGTRDGAEAWQVEVATQRGRTEIDRLADVDADLRLVGNELYVGGYQSRVVKLAADSGQELWSVEVSSHEPQGVDWLHVYVTDADSEVLALDRTNGATLWRQNALRLRSLTGPTPYNRAVVVGDHEGYVHWLAAEDGRLLASARADGGAITGTPLVVGENLYVQTDGGTLTAFKAESGD